MKKITVILASLVFFAFLAAGAVLFWAMPDAAVSPSERRPLRKMPELTVTSIENGEFFEDFETYAADQTPFRESLKTVKAVFERYVFGRLESNGTVRKNGSAVKLKTSYHSTLLAENVSLWENIANRYCPSAHIYYSIIPDKAYFLRDTFYPTIDYDALSAEIGSHAPEKANEIPLWDVLSLSDYYRTDLHWRQERLYPVAQALSEAMGREIDPDSVYSPHEIGAFSGTYAGQSSLPMKPDTLYAMTSDTLAACRVTAYRLTASGTEKREIKVYSTDLPDESDLYSLFLGGSEAVLEIVNEKDTGGKTLVILRDSFASSLTPYLVSGYKRIVLLDTRYAPSKAFSLLPELNLEEADDLLCLYSVTALTETQMR